MTSVAYSAPLDLVTTAVLALLNGSGRKVWDGAYGGNAIRPAYPYAVLYRISGGSSDPLPDLDGDPLEQTVAYQVTAVSDVRNECENTARILRDRVLAWSRADADWVFQMDLPDGWQVIRRAPDDVLAGIDQSGKPPAAVFSLPFRFYLTIAPT